MKNVWNRSARINFNGKLISCSNHTFLGTKVQIHLWANMLIDYIVHNFEYSFIGFWGGEKVIRPAFGITFILLQNNKLNFVSLIFERYRLRKKLKA